MEKKLYWLIESSMDLSVTCLDTETCNELLKSDFESIDADDQKEMQYTITPVWYTDEEFENLPEAE